VGLEGRRGEGMRGSREEGGGGTSGEDEVKKANMWSNVTCLCLPRQSLPVSPLL
jgi:hypothetical protein